MARNLLLIGVLKIDLTRQIPGMHAKTPKRQYISKRRQSMNHTELLIHGSKLRIYLRNFLILRPPNFFPNLCFSFYLVSLFHHLDGHGSKDKKIGEIESESS